MKKVFFTSIFMILLAFESSAQCAMCKATAESSGAGGGLNDGIIYLMFIPYVLLGAFVVFVLRKQIKSFYKQLRNKDDDRKEYKAETWY